jgi:hypothetical protein
VEEELLVSSEKKQQFLLASKKTMEGKIIISSSVWMTDWPMQRKPLKM